MLYYITVKLAAYYPPVSHRGSNPYIDYKNKLPYVLKSWPDDERG